MAVTWRKSAVKVLRRMQPAKAQAIRLAVGRFAADPSAPNNNIKPLKGVDGAWRIRVGDWRISLTIDPETGDADVFEVAPRGGAYR